MKYRVHIDDDFQHGDEGERYLFGQFEAREEILAASTHHGVGSISSSPATRTSTRCPRRYFEPA